MAEHPAAGTGTQQSVTSCLVRLAWIAGGNILLAMFAILIARAERWTLTAKDVAFWLILGSIVTLRYLDWKAFSGTTADGALATVRDVRRYAAWLVGVWFALWTIAQSLELG